jgi:inorganic pyrophosphatase
MDVVIEIQKHSRIKYELDVTTNRLRVDRILNMPMAYPLHYGFIPATLGEDGDELDAVIYASSEFDDLLPNSVISCRPVGVLLMEDEKGMDHKIICVPEMDTRMSTVKDLSGVDADTLKQLTYFFDNYKTFYKDKWSKVFSVQDVDEARRVVADATARMVALQER